MVRTIITGANGAMGQVLATMIAHSDDFEVVAGVDLSIDRYENKFPVYKTIGEVAEQADLIIDFSRPEALENNLQYAKQKKLPLVIATTGINDEQRKRIHMFSSDIPIFFTANMSLGVNLQLELVRQAASFFGTSADIEIVERHHNIKSDAPSGTAIMLAEAINDELDDSMRFQFGRHGLDAKRQPNEIGLHAIRGGKIVGEHDVLFITDEELLEIRHRSESKKVFAAGALRAARYLLKCPVGLYSMHDIVGGVKTVTGVYADRDVAVITLEAFPSNVKNFAEIFTEIASHNVNIDIISQSIPRGSKVDLTFSFSKNDMRVVEQCIKRYMPNQEYMVQSSVCKVTIEGMGMENSSGVAAKLFAALGEKYIGVLLVTTSETKIAFCVDMDDADTALQVTKTAFGL